MRQPYNKAPLKEVTTNNRTISIFSTEGDNIDPDVVKGFGEEWLKFNKFSDEAINALGKRYFDILGPGMINKNSYGLDVGCGTGRWTKYLSDKIGFIEAVDPSDAVFAADKLLNGIPNVRISKASVETIPFNDETFDFVMSVGVLHHIPNTQQAMNDCVKKLKRGGYFYCYLYYNLDNRGSIVKIIFLLSDLLRRIVSKLPAVFKKAVCDLLAIVLYMPFVLLCRLLVKMGLKRIASKIPLYDYVDTPFFVIRNDALDRFGTSLEQRFSRQEIIAMMENSGLENIVLGAEPCYYRAVGRKK